MDFYISKNRIIKNIFYISSENITKILIGLISNIVVARYLGPLYWGKLVYILNFTFLFTPFFTFGLDEQTILLLTQRPQDRDTILGNSIFLRMIGGIIGIIIIFLILVIFSRLENEPSFERKFIIILSFFSLARIIDPINNYFEAIVAQKQISHQRIYIYLIGLFSKITFIFFQLKWVFFFYVSCFELVAIAFSYLKLFQKISPLKNLVRINKEVYIELLRPSIFTFINLFMFYLITNVDEVIIGTILGHKVLGYYSIASKIVILCNFIPITILSSTLSKISFIYKNGEESKYREEIQKYLCIIILIALFLTLGTFITAPFIIKYFYGNKYSPVVNILQFYSLLYAALFIIIARIKFLIVQGHTFINLMFTSIMAILKVIISIILVKKIGVLGPIQGTFISFILSYLIMSLFSSTVRNHLFDIFVCFKHLITIVKNIEALITSKKIN